MSTDASSRATRGCPEIDLEVARLAAVAVGQVKSSFLSHMSHELRTPLNAVLGFSQLLQMDERHPLDSTQRQHVQAVVQAGWHLLRLIDDVLDFARIDAGMVRLNIVPVSMCQVLDEALEHVTPVLAHSGLTLSVDGPPLAPVQAPVVRADKVRLTQVIVNLLTNAIKYNSVGGTVRIMVNPSRAGMASISVADTGRGLTAAQLSCIFEPFNRQGQEHSCIPGAGIGLVITKRLVELMDGTLTVDSVPGEGSRFEVLLPSMAAA